MTKEEITSYLKDNGWTRFEMNYADEPHIRSFWRAPNDCYSPSEESLCNHETLSSIANLVKLSILELIQAIKRHSIICNQQNRENEQNVVIQRIKTGNLHEQKKFSRSHINLSKDRFAEARKRGNIASAQNAR